MAHRTRQINERGIGMHGGSGERMADIRIYDENGQVLLFVEILQRCGGGTDEALQYLTPTEAMAFAKALERCAVQALKDSA